MIDIKRITGDLEKLYEGIEPYCCSQVEKTFRDAISALKQQSEAERRIEEIMEWCLSDKETESTRENIATERAQCEILEILEGKVE